MYESDRYYKILHDNLMLLQFCYFYFVFKYHSSIFYVKYIINLTAYRLDLIHKKYKSLPLSSTVFGGQLILSNAYQVHLP